MILRYHKMDIVMSLLMILAIINECVGMDPDDMEWTPELKQKLFQVFHRTFPNTSEHSQRMLDLWNRENPLHRVSDHNALHRRAMPLIENKRIKLKYPEMGQIEWPREMIVDLLYLRNKVINEEGGSASDLKANWKLLYPYHRMNADVLKRYSRYLQGGEFQLTKQELREAEQKYNQVHAKSMKQQDFFKKERREAGSLKPQIKWTPELKTDLWYIAHRLEASGIPLISNLKAHWDRMNKKYTMITEEALVTRFKRLKKEDFVSKVENLEDAKARYDRLPSIGHQDHKGKKRYRRIDEIPIYSSQPNPHEWHEPFDTTLTLEYRGLSSSHPVDYTYHQRMNGSDTPGASSNYHREVPAPRDRMRSPSQFHQYESHQQHLNGTNHSPFYQGNFSDPSGHHVHPFTSSFNPYMYHPGHDLGEGSSSQPPGDSRGQ